LRELKKIFLAWMTILGISILLAFLSSWNIILLSVIVGAIISFLPAFLLGKLAEVRKWNIENIEKIYAPLKREIDDLALYFSPHGRQEYGKILLADYGEDRSKLLSMDVWLKITQSDFAYRLSLDDEKLTSKLASFYFILSFYMKSRTALIKTILDPLFLSIRQKVVQPHIPEKLERVRNEVINVVLDTLPPSKEITSGWYQYTNLPQDYEELRKEAKIHEKSFHEFLIKVSELIKGDDYDILVEQRTSLYRDSLKIQAKIYQKLGKALPT
jgi:hypothetical protein